MKPFKNWLLAVITLTVLAATFTMYSHPDFLMTLANQVWGCF
jgi:hypothetical protein